MIYIVFGLAGAVVGAIYLHGQGKMLVGAGIGLLLAAMIHLRNRLVAVEQRLKILESHAQFPSGEPAMADEGSSDRETDPSPATGANRPIPAGERPGVDDNVASRPTPSISLRASTADIPSLELELADPPDDAARSGGAADSTSLEDSPIPRQDAGRWFRRWLLGGNVVVRVGVVVLLFGFAFLVKYAAARNLVPLEVRLAAAFAAGMGLLGLGWRLRDSRFAYAITLQGGGIGVMYLTLFAAARLFHLVPLPLVFGLMVGLVGFSGALAVLQNAAAMAVIGAAGGFMAPVLLSTGTGSHVMLFSYYGLLNAGVFGIAWFKAWRWLNLLGFVFTFGIGSAWGIQYYRPPYFGSTEPFLVIFFLFYLAIAVLFAFRQPPQLKGYVDGTLVFGLPLVVFGLQAGLVEAIPYGLAFTAVAMGMTYAGLATLLWRRQADGLRTLVEAFWALGVIFGSLAIPLALSGSWTAVTWSLEGAGLVWVGLRQRRWLARTFGVLLQIGSGVLFLMENHGSPHAMLVFNSHFLGGMMMGAAGLFSAFMLERHQDRLHALERALPALTMTWGVVWWLAAGTREIDRIFSHRYEWLATVAYIGISTLAMGFCHRHLGWKGIRFPAMGMLPVMMLTGALIGNHHGVSHPFQGWWGGVWPILFAVHLYLLRVMDTAWPAALGVAWHTAGALLAVALITWEAGWWAVRLGDGAGVWGLVAWGGVPAVVLGGVKRFARRVTWPSGPGRIAYRIWLPMLLAAGMMAWSLASLAASGNPRPLPYLPLINPLDLVQAFVFMVIIDWLMDVVRKREFLPLDIAPMGLWAIVALGTLFWLTAVVARTVHAFASIPYRWDAMLHADIFQAAISVLWGGLALGGMVAAHRLSRRSIWFFGASLLGIVVVKLFMVDLSGSGTISRIVSFLAVGILMLVIGFFTPLPPTVPKGSRS